MCVNLLFCYYVLVDIIHIMNYVYSGKFLGTKWNILLIVERMFKRSEVYTLARCSKLIKFLTIAVLGIQLIFCLNLQITIILSLYIIY